MVLRVAVSLSLRFQLLVPLLLVLVEVLDELMDGGDFVLTAPWLAALLLSHGGRMQLMVLREVALPGCGGGGGLEDTNLIRAQGRGQ